MLEKHRSFTGDRDPAKIRFGDPQCRETSLTPMYRYRLSLRYSLCILYVEMMCGRFKATLTIRWSGTAASKPSW